MTKITPYNQEQSVKFYVYNNHVSVEAITRGGKVVVDSIVYEYKDGVLIIRGRTLFERLIRGIKKLC